MSAIWEGLQEVLGGVVSFFYGLIPNLGVAIIFLTIVVGLAMFPLTLKQTRSMKAMQELQPEIKRLQKDLKHDRQALQEQTMALYRERGVNPAAGCLPLILQMPIWFALFSVLRSFGSDNPAKYVLEGSRLAGDIVQGEGIYFLGMDLTQTPRVAFDQGVVGSIPYLITILIVMATAYYQQRQTMSRSQAQGQQQAPGQAIMKIFPFFFGFISFQMFAGLVVYFAASQIFRIGQQGFILWLDERRAEKEPAAKARDVQTESTPPPAEESSESEDSAPRRTQQGSGPGKQGRQPRRSAPSPQASKKRRGKKRRRK
jgi:YidC/Oxa1 family membrane protein insertase